MPKEKCERGSTNVYKDLGFKNSEEMQAKASLASLIIDIIEEKKWNQNRAASELELTQPKVSLLYRGRLSGFSLGKLIKLLNKLHKDVDIVIRKKTRRSKEIGHVNVICA